MISLVIPCFNEEKNLETIFLKCKAIAKKIDLELVIVNNGSTDLTHELISKKYKKLLTFKYVNVKKNIGYGNGIKQGLKVTTGDYIGWTHADLQTDLSDIIIVEKIIKSNKKNSDLFIKGLRRGRPLIDNFFTFSMTIIESLIFLTKVNDIGAQPTIFKRNLLEKINLTHVPDDFLIDLFFYYLAKKFKYNIERFDVIFPERIYGVSSWNINFLSKIFFIMKILRGSIKIRLNYLRNLYD